MLNIIQIWPVVPEKNFFKVFFILDSFKGNDPVPWWTFLAHLAFVIALRPSSSVRPSGVDQSVRPASVRRLFTFSNISSETTGLFPSKLLSEASVHRGNKLLLKVTG